LATVDRLDLLRAFADRVIVPESVIAEILAHPSDDPTVRAVAAATWLQRSADPQVPAVVQAWDLGKGESAVIAHALTIAGCEAVLDDRLGRRCAAALTLRVTGTLGVVLAAKKNGVVEAARPILDAMRARGMYLSDEILNGALKLVGE
jgi:predicted nucleic acid-binding protein